MTPAPIMPGTAHRSPEQAVLNACLEPGGSEALCALHAALASPAFGWGALVQLAVEQKISCLVTDTLDRTGLLRWAPGRLARFLQRAQRANLHATMIHRHHAAMIASAASRADLGIAACKGIAVEDTLYGGRGAREFSDLDLLVAPEHAGIVELLLANLGYRQHRRCAAPASPPVAGRADGASSAWRMPTGDAILPDVVVDVTWTWPFGEDRGHGYLPQAVKRARCLPLPGVAGSSMPVLSLGDHVALLDDLAARSRAAGRQPRPILAGDRRRLLGQAGQGDAAGGTP